MPTTPLVHELRPVPHLATVCRQFADAPQLFVFDSARQDQRGRYSFLTADPMQSWVVDQAVFGADPFRQLRSILPQERAYTLSGLPPFQGGIAGLLGYELGQCWERLPQSDVNEFEIPAAIFGLYDWVIAWDHRTGQAWIVVQPLGRSVAKVEGRLNWIKERLCSAPTNLPTFYTEPRGPLTSMHLLPGTQNVLSNSSKDEYLAAVQRVIDYIYAGDIFQANLSQRLLARTSEHPLQTYLRLREANPAPFGGYIQHADWAVLSSSPEQFLEVRGNRVRTRPIKGTRQRRGEPQLDLLRQDELRESEKDHAENVMIVDLLRNDLSRVCQPGSIAVPELCTVETYETVSHLVSEVTGELEEGHDFWDLLTATFPGGSITGAPKVRAMEIIAELEQVARGPYCGSMFYLSCDGAADSNILIRTMTARGGWLQFPVGGGIVAASRPEAEYAETLHKAQGMLRAIESVHQGG